MEIESHLKAYLMQLYALDNDQQPVSANHAYKRCDYTCLECGRVVRLRGGVHKQDHFYHLERRGGCSLGGKSMVHLQVQCLLKKMFPEGECFLEVRFQEINRIADVVWEPKKLIFEVQCSPISGEEVMERNKDYQSLGYQVVWLLHDQRFNKWRVSGAEQALRLSTYYFTNVNIEGKGSFYDLYDSIIGGVRQRLSQRYNVDLRAPRSTFGQFSGKTPQVIQKRQEHWHLCFSGDLVDRFVQDPNLFDQIWRAELRKEKTFLSRLWRGFFYLVIRPYKLLFQILLEKCCR